MWWSSTTFKLLKILFLIFVFNWGLQKHQAHSICLVVSMYIIGFWRCSTHCSESSRWGIGGSTATSFTPGYPNRFIQPHKHFVIVRGHVVVILLSLSDLFLSNLRIWLYCVTSTPYLYCTWRNRPYYCLVGNTNCSVSMIILLCWTKTVFFYLCNVGQVADW